MTRKPAAKRKAPRWLRQRLRADGSLRLWWEPSLAARQMGFATTEFDGRFLSKALHDAEALNRKVDLALSSGQRCIPTNGTVTVVQVVQEWQNSLHYTHRIKPKTQNGYRVAAARIVRKWGDVPIAEFTKKTITIWYENLFREAGPQSARVLKQVFSMLFDFAETQEWRPENSNPCAKIRTVAAKRRARVVTWAEYDALQAAALACGLPSMAAAITLSMLQGQRETDVMQARRGDFTETSVRFPGARVDSKVWVWSLTRSKRGNAGMLLLHTEIIPLIEALLNAPGADTAPLIIEERIGRAYDENLFTKRFAEVRAAAVAAGAASVASIQFRDLRRSFGVMARRGGASVDDTGDVLGNSVAKDAGLKETYMPPEFFTAARAVLAVQRPKEPVKINPKRKAG